MDSNFQAIQPGAEILEGLANPSVTDRPTLELESTRIGKESNSTMNKVIEKERDKMPFRIPLLPGASYIFTDHENRSLLRLDVDMHGGIDLRTLDASVTAYTHFEAVGTISVKAL